MRLFSPFKMLLALVVTISALRIAYVAAGVRPSDAADVLTPICLGLAVVLWVMEDARLRRRVPCFDFGFLIAFFFPVSLCWYVFWSRGWKGIFTLAGVFGLMIFPQAAAVIAWVLLYNPA
jgi:hypothetical protein